jgi:hypothetical protein
VEKNWLLKSVGLPSNSTVSISSNSTIHHPTESDSYPLFDLQPKLRRTPKLEESSLRIPSSNSDCYQQPQNFNRSHRDSS